MTSQKWPKKKVKHALTAVQLVMTVATLAMVAYMVSRPTSPSKTSDTGSDGDSCNLLTKYPGRFRTSVDVILKSVNHGCCSSKQLYYTPTYFNCSDDGGLNRTMAVFAGHRQYFQHDSCTMTDSCKGTACKCNYAIATAVYDKGDTVEGCDKRYGICAFWAKGCCKCVNTKAEEAGKEEDV